MCYWKNKYRKKYENKGERNEERKERQLKKSTELSNRAACGMWHVTWIINTYTSHMYCKIFI